MNQTNSPYKEHLEVLHNSTMFHMSLGSKELFHSNFLHWISIVNWGAFLQIMHDLAGLEKDEVFWWEKKDVLDCHEKPYRPDNNNIEVRREFHNFDLSIYILDSEKEPDESPCPEDNNSEENKGKWIPVLILENKMKSFPYKEQLERYSQKAFDEWRTGEKIKTEARTRNSQGKVLENKYGITFILLSLMEPTLNNYGFSKEKVSKNPKYTIRLTSEWKHKTYNELLESIDRTKTMPGWDTKRSLDQLVVDDYRKFVGALYDLASSCWTIKPEESYRLQISPWGIENIDAKDKRNEIEEYKKLRIHDIHEKLLYDQLLSLLERELGNNNLSFCRYSKEAIQEQVKKDSKDQISLFTNSSYAHGIGIFEVQYILSESFIPKKGQKELFKLIIQVQGDRYCHMVVYDNIVDDTNKKNLKVNNKVLETVWKDQKCLIQDISSTINRYISISGSVAKFPIDGQAIGSNPSFGKYGENLIYQWVKIPEGKSINDVINAIINDVCSIKGWFNSKKSHPDF